MILLSLIAIIVLIALLASRQTDQRGTVEFYAAAQDAAVIHDDASKIFGEAFASIGLISRQDLTRRLETVAERTAEASALLDIDVPSSIGVPYGTMATASRSWTDGSLEVDRIVVGIMDGDIVASAVAELQLALDQMRVGDVAFEQFTDSIDEDVPSFSSVSYVGDDPADPLKFNATNLVLRIQSAYALAPHRDVSVLGMTDPEAVGDRDGIPVVPSSDSIGVTALVTNLGNEDESSVTVALEIFNLDSNEKTQLSDVIDDLAAGASTAVAFANLDVEKGSLYQLKLTVTINADIAQDNNEWEMKFIWNAES
ncbi:MAG: hypothetical protein ACC654_08325 [Acidimicrobiia bacterium]